MPVYYHEGKFPPKNLDWEKLAVPLTQSATALAKYDSFLGLIPNPEILTSPMMTQEAVISSKIEGTQATAGDVLAYEAGDTNVSPDQENDIREIVNYRVAMREAEEMLVEIPLSGRILREAHKLLLSGVRGRFKSPGRYRVEDNWIGSIGSSKETARYVPIETSKLEDAMAKWEIYVNSDVVPPLVKIAIAHAEFESIHPFADGNGRIGRMMIPLMLWNEKFLTHPCFYLSAFFDRNNDEYRDRLLGVSKDNQWTEWVVFFLEAIAEQASDNYEKASKIYELYRKTGETLAEKSRSVYAWKLTDKLFEYQVFSTKNLSDVDGASVKTIKRLLHILQNEKVIKEVVPHGGQRPSIYVFTSLLRITEGNM